MDYQDASQTGSVGNSEPVARPDVDTLPAGSFGPATGNAITGAGTTTGAAGADAIENPPATIVEVHGAGGATTGSDGSFQAVGQYGVLNMDARGDFSYARNAGTPDGVQDVFSYTVANGAGANSSTTLTIDIVAAAAAQGVVNLPAGVELSDIHVNGRDLVIDMPDGTQMVIPGGAVFVPQLAIGDVEVPPSNLAALLIGSEPQPAAGTVQSSGGNFAEPVPPLDPGVPLGDLIPPTELSYTPPEFEEVNQFEDNEPTVVIVTPDNPAGAVNATDHVDESGLPARDGEPEGTLEPQDIESTSGTIVFTAEDGLDSVTVNGVAINAVGQQIEGEHGVLTITSIDIDGGQIGYSYTATDNTTDGVNDFEDFTIVVTDDDGDAATGTLHIDIADDEPIALDDIDTLNADEQTADGNVMTGADTTTGAAGKDTVGADNATLTAVSGADGSDSEFNDDGNLVVHGAYGTLSIDAEGNYTYVRDEGAPDNVEDVFEYTLTDGDGDPVTATLTIIVPDLNEPPVVSGSAVNVSEEGLAGGNPDTTGTPDTTNSKTASGDIGLSDPDNDATTVTLGIPTGSFTSGGTAVNWAVSADGHTLVGYTGSNSATNHVIEITINNAGQYTVNLIEPFDDANKAIEDAIGFTVPVSVNDGTETVSTTISVTVEDDAPLATDNSDTVDEQTLTATGNVISGASTSGGADSFGGDGPGSLTAVSGAGGSDSTFENGNLVVRGEHGTLTINAQGQYTYVLDEGVNDAGSDQFTYTIVDADGDVDTATLTITIPDLNDAPSITGSEVHVSEEGLPGGIPDEFGDPDTTNQADVTVTAGVTPGAIVVSDPDNDALTVTLSLPTDSQTYYSGGQEVHWTLADNGHQLIGYTGSDPDAEGSHVIEVTIQNNGTYEVELLQPFDDPNTTIEDSIDFNVTVTVSDGQESDTANLHVIVEDDMPTAKDPPPDDEENPEGPHHPIISAAVDEDDLQTGNHDEANGDDLGAAAPTTVGGAAGDLAALFNPGADTPLQNFGFGSTDDLPELTSDKQPVLYNVDGDKLTGYVESGATEGFQEGEDSAIFTLTVSDNGAWSFTLLGQLDHEAPDEGQTAFENNLELDFSAFITAEDADGDPVTAVDGTFVINVDDDIPTAKTLPPPTEGNPDPGPLVTGAVDEDDLQEQDEQHPTANDNTTGNHDHIDDSDDEPVDNRTGDDADTDPTTTGGGAGSLDALFNPGADRPLSYSIGEDTKALEEQGLSSNGKALLYEVTAGTNGTTVLTAYADLDGNEQLDEGEKSAGNTVFTLTVGEDGSWEFDLQDQLDHSEAGTEDNLLIDFGSVIVATDADGDSATAAPGTFIVDVDDDMPQPFDSNPEDQSDECPDPITVTNDAGSDAHGSLNLPLAGADEPGKASFEIVDGTAVVDGAGKALTAEGHALFYFVNDDGVLEAREGNSEGADPEGTIVFTITLNEDGSYDYHQSVDIMSTTTLHLQNFDAVGGGNVEAKAVDIPDSEFDLIVSTESGETVNTNEGTFGVSGGQSLESGELIRFDLVKDSFTTGSGSSAVVNFGEYYEATAFRQDVSGLASDQRGNFIVRAITVDEADGSDPSDPADGDGVFFGDSNDDVVLVTQINIYDASGNLVDPDDYSSLGIDVEAAAGGGWQITGLPNEYDYEITSDTPFNAVQVEATDGSGTFKLGAIDLSTQTETGVDFSVPVTFTDADGDPVVCDIDVNLGAPTTSPDVGAQVDEAALDTNGSNPGSDSETTGGDLSLIVSGGSGETTFALHGDDDGTATGSHGTITLGEDGKWTYTLTDPVDGPDANDGPNVEDAVETFTYDMIQGGEVVGTGTITIDIKDDVPTANNDTDSIPSDGDTATGNVITGADTDDGLDGIGSDVKGADGAAISAVVGFGATSVVEGDFVVQGHWGTLTIGTDGEYSYVRNSDAPAGETDTFTYTLTDGDGDQDTATLEITIANATPTVDAPDAEAPGTLVDEKGLAASDDRPGEPAGTGEAADGVSTDDDDTSETSSEGTITFTQGDTPATVKINDTVVDSVGDTVEGDYGTLTITEFNAETGTIKYTYTLGDNVDNQTITGDEFTVTVTDADNQTDSDTFTVEIRDDGPIAADDTDEVVEGHSVEGNVLTGEGGDGNTAGADTPGADGLPENATVVGVVKGGDDTTDTVNTNVGTEFDGEYGHLTLNADGSYTYTVDADTNPPANAQDVFTYTIVDNDGSLSSATLTIDVIDDLKPSVDAPDADAPGTDVYETGLAASDDRPGEPAGRGEAADGDSTNDDDTSETSSEGTITFTPGDEPATVKINDTEVSADGDTVEGLYGTLTITDFDAETGTIKYTYTLKDNVDNQTITGDEFTVTVTDSDDQVASDSFTVEIHDDTPLAVDDSDEIVEGVATTATGNVIDGTGTTTDPAGVDIPGADGGLHIVGLEGTDSDTDGTDGFEVQGTYGTLTMNSAGTYTYTLTQEGIDALNGLADGVKLSDTFSYTIEDSDGSQSIADLVIDLTGSNDGPSVGSDTANVSEEGLEGGLVDSIGYPTNDDDHGDAILAEGTIAISDPDGDDVTVTLSGAPTNLTVDGQEVFWEGSGTNTLNAYVMLDDVKTPVMEITIDNDGNYSVTLQHAIDHQYDGETTAEGNFEDALGFDITVDASDGTTSNSGTLHIVVDDDSPATFTPDSAELDNDSDSITGVPLDLGNGGDDAAGVGDNYGADGPGTVRFPASLEGPSALTSGGETIYYHVSTDGLTLYAYVDTAEGDPDGFQDGVDDTIFTVTLDPTNSSYDVNVEGHVDSKSDITFDPTLYDFVGQNSPWTGFVPIGEVDGKAKNTPVENNSNDLLITPFGQDGHGDSINGTANEYGTGGGGAGQNVGYQEGIRFDFVYDLTGNPAAGSGGADYDGQIGQQDHHFTTHYPVNDVAIRFGQGTGNSTVQIEAFNLDDADDYVLGAGTLVNITRVVINYDGESQVFNFDEDHLSQTENVGIAGGATDRSYTVEWISDVDGVYHVEVTGIMDNQVQIATHGETDYEALELENISADDPALDWSITGVGAAVETFDPVSFNIPVEIVDNDGDYIAGDPLHITLNPVDSSSSSLTTMSVQSDSSISTMGFESASLVGSNDNGSFQRSLDLNSGNNTALLGAIAAAGLSAAGQAAAHGFSAHDGGHHVDGLSSSIASFESVSGGSDGHHSGGKSSADALTATGSSQHEQIVSVTPDNESEVHNELSSEQHQQGAPTELLQGAEAPAQGQADATANIAAATVAMPSAEQLAAVSGEASTPAQHNQVIGEVLSDSLQGSGGEGHNLDALINSLPGHDGGHGVLEALASHGDAAVSMGHMAAFGHFAAAHNMLSAEAMAMHQDAAPAHG